MKNQVEVLEELEEQLPISVEEWELRARQFMEKGPYHYVVSGSGAEQTLRANTDAFQRYQIIPRMLKNVSQRDLSISLFGRQLKTPLLLAPIGMQAIAHPEGELATAQAAVSAGVPLIASTVSSFSLEQIAEVMGSHPRWFQLYWSSDLDVTLSMVRRAELAGYSAIVLTVDTPMLGRRESDLEQRYSPLKLGKGSANYLQDPVFREKLGYDPEDNFADAMQSVLDIVFKPDLTWTDLSILKQHTKLPLLIKGILHEEDAKRALDHGADGIVVSNHGGRQLDGAISSLKALPVIADVVQGRVPILFDSGIRRGADVFKAIALGADAVLLGRPYIYGLAVAGRKGVSQVIRDLIADLDVTLALSGQASLSEVHRACVQDS